MSRWPLAGRAGKIAVLEVRRFSPITRSESTIAETIPTAEKRHQRSLQLAMAAARTADDNRGQDIVLLDMRGVTPEFDYFVLVTGNSRRQLHAISEEIDRTLESELHDRRMGIEGYSESRWILLDYGSVVIHLFDTDTRAFYALEDLWATSQRVPLPWLEGRDRQSGGQDGKETTGL